MWSRITPLALLPLAAAACQARPRAAEAPPPRAAPGEAPAHVFTDSAAHAAHCEPVRAGEDWRRVCTPRDQRVRVP